MKYVFQLFLPMLITFGFSACGGGGSGGTTATTVTGTFVDDPVVGLNYSCSPSNRSGTTNNNGQLTCVKGDSATFTLGNLFFGPIAVLDRAIISPYDIFPNNSAAALNLARLLQGLDDNLNDSVITPNGNLVAQIATQYNFSATETEFENQVKQDLPNITMPSSQEAKTQMDQGIQSSGGTPSTVTYSWELSAYGSCEGMCGTDNGTQTRTVTCKASDGTTASDSMCTQPKPTTTQTCTASVCPTPDSNTTANWDYFNWDENTWN